MTTAQRLKLQFKRNAAGITIFSLAALLIMPAALAQEAGSATSAPSQEDEAANNLRSAIEQKARELEAINKQISENQGNLEEAVAKGKTLKQEIGRLDS